MKQNGITLFANVKKDKENELRAILLQIKEILIANQYKVFEGARTIHYARWVIVEEAYIDKEVIPTQLVFSSNFDGTIKDHLTFLSQGTQADIIDKIYENCEGYPEGSERDLKNRYEFLKSKEIKYEALYRGAPGRTVDQIRQESKLREYIRNFLNQNDWKSRTPSQVHQAIKKNVLENKDFQWVKEKISLPRINWLALILFGILVLLLVPIIIIWILVIQIFYERKDVPLGLTPSQIDETHIKKLESYEDLQSQNQFTQVLIMKRGKMRLYTVKALMVLAKVLSKNLFIAGNLMGIPTIHFARWVMMDDNKRMIFFSNFDGSWQQYLGDFIDKSGWGLSAIWSNSEGFPKTRFLFTKGAYDEERFLAWSRFYEIQTQVWYNAYPHLSIKNVINNSCIRAELVKDLNEKKAEKFLQRL
jgi:hypothetical protein